MKAIHKKLLARVVKEKIQDLRLSITYCENSRYTSPKYYEEVILKHTKNVSMLEEILIELTTRK